MVNQWIMNQPAASQTKRPNEWIGKRDVRPAAVSTNRMLKLARGAFFLFALLVLFSGFTIVHSLASTNEIHPATGTEQIVYVQGGDSLWLIADTHKKAAMDTRKAIYLIMQRNDLKDSALTTGQELIIPEAVLP